jgi:hypothetical protein
MPDAIKNGDFEKGLSGWHVVSGQAFTGQPVSWDSIRANDVEIDGHPRVPLGGDYWHVPYPLAEENTKLVRVSTKFKGTLDSDVFRIELPYLAFRLGGSKTKEVALELRVPVASARIPGFPALDSPDADGFVAVRIQNPSGSDIPTQFSWNLADQRSHKKGLLKSKAKVRLRISGTTKRKLRLVVDKIQLLPKPPPPPHLPLWGWADLHCHPMAQAGFGGLLAGHMHGPVEDLGSCLHDHGWNHSNPLHPMGLALQTGARNDGSLAVPGWAVGEPQPGDQLGFQDWPRFDDLIHIKTHQDWIRRAYDGGQRLMVALVVHNELLASLASQFPPWFLGGQSDRDTVEPQVQMLKEFVEHNKDWCGLAKTPAEARALIEQNKMSFVLGLETDSVNGWVKESDFNHDDGKPRTPKEIRDLIYPYFKYLRDLGIVQINLVHLSDNAFGGMALYEPMSLYNTFQRTGNIVAPEDGYHEADGITPRPADEQISKPVPVLPEALQGVVEGAAQLFGIQLPQGWTTPNPPVGNRNARPMSDAGKMALRVAMQLGMVIDMDHMSEKCTVDAFNIAMSVDETPRHQPYPLIVAHNGARYLSPRPLDDTSAPIPGYRRSPEAWPSEGAKSNTQLGYIVNTGGIFGHGTSVAEERDYPEVNDPPVTNDCPGTTKSFAQGYQYVTDKLSKGPFGPLGVALGTDLNVLLAGLGPRFGPQSASGLAGEIGAINAKWQDDIRKERLDCAEAQDKGVHYSTPLRDWRAHRFPDSGLYYEKSLVPGEDHLMGHLMWQAMALLEVVSNDPQVLEAVSHNPQMKDAAMALAFTNAYLQDLRLDLRVFNMVAGMIKSAPQTAPNISPDYYHAGQLMDDEAVELRLENDNVQAFVPVLRKIRDQWKAMTDKDNNPPLIRYTAGPVRDFDFNLDGLAHYGMLPDMLQDLKNVHLSLDGFFRSAEAYIRVWERCAKVGARIQL